MQYNIKAEGKTYEEALNVLRKQHGNGVIVYDQKKIPVTSLFGKLFKRKQYQLTAALSEKARFSTSSQPHQIHEWQNLKPSTIQKTPPKKKNKIEQSEEIRIQNEETIESITFLQNFAEKLNSPNLKPSREIISRPSPNKKTYKLPELPKKDEYNEQFSKIERELLDIKKMLPQQNYFSEESLYDGEFRKIYSILRDKNMSSKWSSNFIGQLQESLPKNKWNNKTTVSEQAFMLLESSIRTKPISLRKKIVTFVGPTGVGKTTNLAKIAQRLKFVENRSVHFITIDKFRIAAKEQLQLYADIMFIPFSYVRNNQELKEVIANSNDTVFLMDTSGFSPQNHEMLEKQKSILDGFENQIETILVLAANIKNEDAQKIIESFSLYSPSIMLLSKLDETSSPGYFIELSDLYQLPISYLANGQKVPEDISQANSGLLSKMILQDYYQPSK